MKCGSKRGAGGGRKSRRQQPAGAENINPARQYLENSRSMARMLKAALAAIKAKASMAKAIYRRQ